MNEQQLRHVIRQIISEQRQVRRTTLLEYGDDDGGGKLYKAFVRPFVDVAVAAKLTSQDLLNTFKLIFKTLITVSPEKLVKAREDYEKTRDSLAKEWDPIMKRVDDSIDNSDFGLVAFAVAPNLFFGRQIGKFATNAPETVVDYFEKAGWDVPLSNWLKKPGTGSDDSGRGGRSSRGSGSGSESDGIGDKIRKFFFGESIDDDGDLLTEAEEDKPQKLSSKNIDSELNKYFKETGFDKTLDDLTNQIIAAKEAHAKKLIEASQNQINTLKSFAAAKDLAEFEKALSDAKSSGADVDAIQKKLDELKKDLEKKSEELKKDEKFKADIQKKSKDKKMSDADFAKAADNAAVEASSQALKEIKSGISESLNEAFGALKKQMREELMKDMPNDKEPLYKSIMSTSNAKRIMDVIERAVNSVGAVGG